MLQLAGTLAACATAAAVLLLFIRERQRSRTAAAKAGEIHERLREVTSLLESVPAIVYIDAPGTPWKTTYMSPQVEKMLGLPVGDLIGQNSRWADHIHPHDRERVLDESARHLGAGEPQSSDYRMIKSDGELVWVSRSATIVRDEKGAPLFSQGIIFDVTERKKMEQRLSELESSGQVSASARAVGTAAMQVLQTTSEQAAGVAEQSAAAEQTTVTMERLKELADDTAISAEDVARRAARSAEIGANGSATVDVTIGRMDDIRARVEAIAQNILALSEQAHQIGEITATVEEFAEQSNLLALNATIEAARAGEQGKGFAVVAGEVRNLAEQSSAATAQVRSILGDVQKATAAAVMSTEQGVRAVEDGTDMARLAGEAIARLSETISETVGAAEGIAASAREQSLAVDDAATAMSDINRAAGQFVVGIGESKTAAGDLARLAEDLALIAERYSL